MATSYSALKKPWLQFRDEFAGLSHLVELYEFWCLTWAADTKTTQDLEHWEYEICKGSFSYIQVGLAFHVVRLKLGSRSKKFENFCNDSPYGSVSYVRQIIKAALVAIDLMNEGFTKLPTCVSQALPLAKFCSSLGKNREVNSSELATKWQEVIDTSPCGQITASHVKAVVDGEQENPKATIKIDKKLKESLDREARERGVPVAKLLDEILAERYQESDGDAGTTPEEAASEPESELTPYQLKILDECERQIFTAIDPRAIGPVCPLNSS